MSKRRVVVAGMGIVSPLGNDLASNWDGICNGRSGIGPDIDRVHVGLSLERGGHAPPAAAPRA